MQSHSAADRASVIGVLVRAARLGADFPEIEELDINPLVALAGGAIAANARVLLGESAPSADQGSTRSHLVPA